jgi:hypothetical protein
MGRRQRSYPMKYRVSIKDPSTNRACDAYIACDRDLEVLLLFLRSPKSLEYDVSDSDTEIWDP